MYRPFCRRASSDKHPAAFGQRALVVPAAETDDKVVLAGRPGGGAVRLAPAECGVGRLGGRTQKCFEHVLFDSHGLGLARYAEKPAISRLDWRLVVHFGADVKSMLVTLPLFCCCWITGHWNGCRSPAPPALVGDAGKIFDGCFWEKPPFLALSLAAGVATFMTQNGPFGQIAP